jgi:integrase
MAPRQTNRLSAAFVTKGTVPGLYNDGRGLHLQVTAAVGGGVTKSWLLRYKLHGAEHWMGLGSLLDCGLATAREQVGPARLLIRQGIDPIRHRRDQRAAAKAEQLKRLSFREAAAGYIESKGRRWRSEVHLNQWTSSLARYVLPVIGDLQVSDVEVAHVTRVLDQIWATKPPTAERVRGRIEMVLNWATAKGHRHGPNPARWKGLLEHVYELEDVEAEHHAALPYAALPPFYATLAKTEGLPARALETLILTATRAGDVLGARWDEFDFDTATWIIPPHTRNGTGRSTKTGKEHRVPLGSHLVAMLRAMPRTHPELVFPCAHNTVRALLHRLLPDGARATLHGFRSCFSDWAHEHDKSSAFTEQALQHSNGSKVKKAYQRSDALHQRRPLMAQWEQFCREA